MTKISTSVDTIVEHSIEISWKCYIFDTKYGWYVYQNYHHDSNIHPIIDVIELISSINTCYVGNNSFYSNKWW